MRPGSRRLVGIVAVALAVLLAAGGLVATRWIRSPAQQAAEAAPPPATRLTARVVRSVVTSSVVLRGTVTAARQVEVAPVAQGDDELVVTRNAKAVGSRIRPGQVLIEVSGRPVVALPGRVPAYRDLRPGDTGRDVAELQAALSSLGFPGGDRSGHFGAGTKRQVRAFYDRLGYETPTTAAGASGDAAEGSGVDSEQDAVRSARRAVADAEAAVAAAHGRARTDARRHLGYARSDLALARSRYSRAVQSSGAMVPRSEIVFLPSFPARLTSIGARLGQKVSEPLLRIASGRLVVHGQLDPADADLVRTGLSVSILSELSGQRRSGRVSSVSADVDAATGSTGSDSSSAAGQGSGAAASGANGSSSSGGSDSPYLPVVVTPSTSLPADLIGQDVRLTVRSARSSGPVLAVPEAAINASADGRTYVTLADGGRRVAVTAGVSGNGLVEVTPDGTGLDVGAEVLLQ